MSVIFIAFDPSSASGLAAGKIRPGAGTVAGDPQGQGTRSDVDIADRRALQPVRNRAFAGEGGCLSSHTALLPCHVACRTACNHRHRPVQKVLRHESSGRIGGGSFKERANRSHLWS
jgi:hypothetical protein